MKGMEIQLLIECCINYFTGACYSSNRIGTYKSLWRNGIVKYMLQNRQAVYTPSVGAAFVDKCVSKKDLGPVGREKIRSIQVLDDFLNLGYIRKNTVVLVRHRLDGPIGKEMGKLVTLLRNLRRSEITIKDYEFYLSNFLKYLGTEGVQTPEEINEYHIIRFISTHENNKINIVSSLRVLFRFWFDQRIIKDDKESIFKNYQWTRKELIPSYYTPDEVASIESSVDRSGANGKRNYAMLLLATRLGLRASDIAGLAFSNINWKENRINLVQYKTKEPVELPLLADVGNAIIDYLKYGRVKSDSPHLFLSTRAPYVDARRESVASTINSIISKAGVSVKYRHHGPHSMRHSLASTLLRNGTSYPLISEVLGHKHTESTMIYLKIDVSLLMKCALPVPPVSKDFYEQKGGAFYE